MIYDMNIWIGNHQSHDQSDLCHVVYNYVYYELSFLRGTNFNSNLQSAIKFKLFGDFSITKGSSITSLPYLQQFVYFP